jgi:formate dehydrogenase iron-sulfur subunit
MEEGKAILIDTTKCTACRGCQVACKNWNDLPAENTSFFGGPGYQNPKGLSSITFTLLRFFGSGKKGADVDEYGNWQFLKYGCMHCMHPQCKKVCDTLPYKAIYQDTDGFVQINQNACKAAMGCNICMTGCPFAVPQSDGKSVWKCNACIGRRGSVLAPACVSTCPPGALRYGNRNDMIALATARAADPKVREKFPEVNVYGDTGPFGGLRVISILTRKPGFYSLPLESAMY